ncbi:MAG: translocation/assembly module TamB domain-containing protein, partial [Paracoccaceae bacterium]
KLVTPQITAEATGTANGAERRLQLTARLGNLAVLYPQFPGALTAIGTAVQSDAGYQIDLSAKGPGQIDASVKGSLANNFRTADLAISGTATAALANEIATPRSLSGPLRFDLRLRGPLKLSSLSGPVSISGGRLADPAQTFAVQDITGQFQLAGGTAQMKLNAGVSTGGSVVVTGSVGLDSPYPADLAIQIQNVKLRDPELYSTTANGAVTFKGPAIGGALIAGSIDLGQTEIRIPSTGLGANGDLPGLEHVHEPADVHATRVRAGLLGTTGSGRGAAGGYALNLKISAPNQVFIRGRGLDAELGGSLVLRGTTQAIVPSGAFNLIRGRLDILGRRLVLTDAMLQLQGALIPFVRILASVESDGITSSVLIQGDANDPQVTFTSSPDLPQEEVIARLLFDRGLGTLTAFQAIQLASAVAALAGRGGEGVIGNLRKQAGLDNLDVQTDASGNAQITAGKYLSEKIYSEVTVDAGGNSDVSLNLDITKNITLKGHVDTDGKTGIGLFVQKDY